MCVLEELRYKYKRKCINYLRLLIYKIDVRKNISSHTKVLLSIYITIYFLKKIKNIIVYTANYNYNFQ